MPAYFVSSVDVTDPEQFQKYRDLAAVALKLYGGKFLVRGATPEVLEGEWPAKRFTVIEFADDETVRKFYDSPEYKAARVARADAAVFDVISVPGA